MTEGHDREAAVLRARYGVTPLRRHHAVTTGMPGRVLSKSQGRARRAFARCPRSEYMNRSAPPGVRAGDQWGVARTRGAPGSMNGRERNTTTSDLR